MLKNVLSVVDDIEKSIEFYKDLFGLQVILQNEGNVILSEGLVLQDAGLWGKTLDEISTPFNNRMELYFEEFDIDGLLAKYESGKYFVRYATELTEIAGGLFTKSPKSPVFIGILRGEEYSGTLHLLFTTLHPSVLADRKSVV